MKNIVRLMLACGAAIPVMPAYAQMETPPAEAATTQPGTPDPTAADSAPAPETTTASDAVPEATAPVGTAISVTAEAAPAGAEASGSGNRLIEEVIVSAQRRDERLQDVPISVQAFTGEKLDALGVKKVEDLPALTPGLVLQNKAGYTVIFMRGVGTDAFLPSADPNVPVYVDGIPQLSGQGAANVLGRLQRVEVLKGPQGTLFGRNSTGGAISLTTPDPQGAFGGDVTTEFANYDTFNTSFFLNVPVSEQFGATLSGYSNRSDGYYRNVAGPIIDTFQRGARTKLVWNPTDQLTISAFGVYGEQSDPLSLTTKLTRPAPLLSLGGILLPKDPTPRARSVAQDLSGGDALINFSYGGSADWKLDAIELKALGSIQRLNISFAQWDFDSTDRPLITFYTDNQFQEQKTAEIQLLSNEGTPYSEYFSFVAGAFYLTGNGGFPSLQLQVGGANGFGDLPAAILGFPGFAAAFTTPLNAALAGVGLAPIAGLTGPTTLTAGGILSTESLSGYFQGTLNLQSTLDLSTRLNLTLGARLDQETRGLHGGRLGIILPPNNPHSDRIQDQTTLLTFPVPDVSATQVPLRAALNWFPVDDTQLYASFARGFTSPTYNTINFFTPPDQVKASRVDNFEVGAKTQLFDRTLTLNTAAFYVNEYELLTAFLSVTSGGVVRFANAPKARIYGAEFDSTWQALPEIDPGLAFTASGAFLKSKYVSFPDGRGFDTATGLSFGPGSPLPARDFSGNRIVNTPTFTSSVGVNQAINFGNSSVELAANANYNSGYYNTPQQEKLYATKAYTLVDTHVSYFYTPWGIELTGFVRNIFDESYTSSRYAADFGVLDTLNAPRTYGAHVKVTF
ncbi:MAG: hypothetical protein JWQ90_4335 [Hydrocarboniphaga sp.]|uniref:TonB-dependent receptor n=1 Tax=Hydrocarboniphaga sp. TaxID=2033016 RepID=UPI002617D272|nr:TonB-dependent receptor [Hydrocarboniphaga sp.]MDB5971885.1 hypothetical protein [Hydrocarboniphaga sp.]